MKSQTLQQYEDAAAKVGCENYDPCPICYKCRRKASHLYQMCALCEVHVCFRHTEKTREMFIRRENFAITVTDEVAEALKELARKVDAPSEAG